MKEPRRKITGTSRLRSLQQMQTILVQEHQIACSYLTHLSTQPDIEELPLPDQQKLIQTGLEKYATIAQKMLSVLEKLSDHERQLQILSPAEKSSKNDDPPPTSIQWDMLIRHASQQMKKRNPVIYTDEPKDIS